LGIAGKEAFSGRLADMWSVGVTLYVFIFGKCPFMAPNVFAVYQRIIDDQYVPHDWPLIDRALLLHAEHVVSCLPGWSFLRPSIRGSKTCCVDCWRRNRASGSR